MDQSNQTTDLPISSTSDPGNASGDVNQNQQNNDNSDQNITNIAQSKQSESAHPLNLSDLAAQTSGSTQQPPAVPFSQPGQAASPTFNAQAVASQVNATDVPKESVGFSQVEVPTDIAPTDPRDTLDLSATDSPTPAADVIASPTSASTPENPPSDDEKSPLEILEEILAEANTEKSKEGDAKEKKEKEDREFREQLAAKEAAFQEQAAVEISQKREEVEAAKQRRDDVEADLHSQGKGDDQAPDVTDEALTIHQLEHDKVQ